MNARRSGHQWELFQAGVRFGEAMTVVERLLGEEFVTYPIKNYEHYKLLCLLVSGESDGPPTQKDLAKLLSRSPNTICEIVRVMKARGLVSQTEDPDDRRAVRIRATAKGRGDYKRTSIKFKSFLERLLGDLDQHELKSLIQTLDRILDRAHLLQAAGDTYKIRIGIA